MITPKNDPATFGIAHLENPGDTAIQVESIQILSESKVQILGYMLTLNRGSAYNYKTMGSLRGFPPSKKHLDELGMDWAPPVDVLQATLMPGKSYDLMFGLSRDPVSSSDVGVVDQLEMVYTVNEVRYLVTFPERFVLAADEQSCWSS